MIRACSSHRFCEDPGIFLIQAERQINSWVEYATCCVHWDLCLWQRQMWGLEQRSLVNYWRCFLYSNKTIILNGPRWEASSESLPEIMRSIRPLWLTSLYSEKERHKINSEWKMWINFTCRLNWGWINHVDINYSVPVQGSVVWSVGLHVITARRGIIALVEKGAFVIDELKST